MDRKQLGLYLVTDRDYLWGRDLTEIVRAAVRGGVTMVQLREKDTDTRTFVQLGLQLKALLSPLGIPLIINDRIDVALAVDADGVHIGQSDMPYDIARRILGKDKIIGLSVENLQQVRDAELLDVDYIGVSPIYDTPTKTDTAPGFGLEGLRKTLQITSHPSVAIGGMNHKTAPDVMRTGVDGIAVVSAIVASEDPEQAARELKQIVTECH